MDHLIHRQSMEVELQGKNDPFPLQHEVSRVCREELPRLLEAVFDELAPGPAHWRLERLELDLGVLRVTDLERGLLDRVREALREALDRARLPTPSGASATVRGDLATSARSSQGDVEVLSPETSDEALLRMFLETGLVPWWAGRLDGSELETRFLAMLDRHGGRAPGWLHGHGGSKRIARRVLGQFSQATALKLLAALARESGAERLLAAILDMTPPGLAPSTWRHALAKELLPVMLARPLRETRREAEKLLAELAVETVVIQGIDARLFREVLSQRVGGPLPSPVPDARSDSPKRRPVLSSQEIALSSTDTARVSHESHEQRAREAASSSQLPRTGAKPDLARSQEAVPSRTEDLVKPPPPSPREAIPLVAEAMPPPSALPGPEMTVDLRPSSSVPRFQERGGDTRTPEPRVAVDASQTPEPRVAVDASRPRREPPQVPSAPGEVRPRELTALEPVTGTARSADRQRLPTPSAQGSPALPPLEIRREVPLVVEAVPPPPALPEPEMTVDPGAPSSVPRFREMGGDTRTPEPRVAVDTSWPRREPPQAPSATAFPRAPVTAQMHTDEALAPSAAPPNARTQPLEPSPAPRAPRAPSPSPALSAPFLETASEQLLAYGLPVDNAGLVILHPFLKTFFQAVGLFEGKGFRDLAAQCRAVCLLQWLAHGDGAEDEHRMALSKVLCGVPLNEVVPRIDGPTEAERTEGETMLRHVVAQWSVLKNTSAGGLRESFLQRKGLLRREETGWGLRMEARAYDMLLERLPWGLSHIRLSWMTGLLRVER